jgi:hypothetical protein
VAVAIARPLGLAGNHKTVPGRSVGLPSIGDAGNGTGPTVLLQKKEHPERSVRML